MLDVTLCFYLVALSVKRHACTSSLKEGICTRLFLHCNWAVTHIPYAGPTAARVCERFNEIIIPASVSQGQDLASGNLTAPALYAIASPAVGPELQALIDGEFTGDGGLPRALQLVTEGGGIEDAMGLARREGDLVRGSVSAAQDPPPFFG